MLDSEITIEKMKTGLSKIRNRGIAVAFSYMNVVEAWSSGIPKLFQEAREYGLREPDLIDLGSDFRVNLYRKSVEVDQQGVVNPKSTEVSGTIRHYPALSGTGELSDYEVSVIQYINDNGECTTAEASQLLGVKERRARTILSKLIQKQVLAKKGHARNTTYVAGEQFPEFE